jgi:hypothetical protein
VRNSLVVWVSALDMISRYGLGWDCIAWRFWFEKGEEIVDFFDLLRGWTCYYGWHLWRALHITSIGYS